MFFNFPTVLSFTLLSLLPGSLADHDIPGGALIAGTAILKPFTTRVGLQRRSPTLMEGLLQIRQSCPSGTGECNDGGCCPLGGQCCSVGTCCARGDYCVEGGCCPNGEICSGDGGQCSDPSYEPCPNDDFCCPAGNTCYRDSSNTRRCREGSSSGGGGGGGGIATTSLRSTSTQTSPVITDLPDLPSTTHLTSLTSTSRSTVSTQSPRPTPAAGQTTVTYGASDSRISWSGTGWTSVSSSCSTSARRTTVEMQSFTLIVSSAARLYLNLDCLNVAYDVYVNSVAQTFFTDTFDVTQTCTYKQVNLGSNAVNINVTVVVIGLPRNGRRQLDNDWSFQLNEILAITSGAATSTSSTGTNSAFGLKVSWFQGMAATLLAGFGLVL